jgi:MSHA biogenesis protein MshM
MYLEHFGINKFPFALTPNTQFYCDLPSHQEALNILLFSLTSGEGFIKITGEVGSGKTLLCRKLLNLLTDDFVTAYLPNPDLSPMELRKLFAQELEIDVSPDVTQSELFNLLSEKLLKLRSENKRVVLIIDEAQALSNESLEAVRLLTNLETESEKLLQIVLFGQPELDHRLNQHHLRQSNQRITFSYRLMPLNYDDLNEYLNHRLSKAGYTKGLIFEPKACYLLFRASDGIPRIVNILAHKAMLVSYGLGEKRVSVEAMKRAIKDSLGIVTKKRRSMRKLIIFFGALLFFIILGLVYEFLKWLF